MAQSTEVAVVKSGASYREGFASSEVEQGLPFGTAFFIGENHETVPAFLYRQRRKTLSSADIWLF